MNKRKPAAGRLNKPQTAQFEGIQTAPLCSGCQARLIANSYNKTRINTGFFGFYEAFFVNS